MQLINDTKKRSIAFHYQKTAKGCILRIKEKNQKIHLIQEMDGMYNEPPERGKTQSITKILIEMGLLPKEPATDV